MSIIKEKVKQLIFGYKANSHSYIAHLRKIGVSIGNRVTIFDPRNTLIDEQYPWMLSIGDDVQITSGVKILTHSYDWCVLKHKYNHLLGESGKVSIGNNVFIGMNTIIVKNITIGNNVVIGAGSVITKNIPDNVVIAGNPCRIICDLDSYYKKIVDKQNIEAIRLAQCYKERLKKIPTRDIFYDYFWIFDNEKEELWPQKYIYEMSLTGNFDECITNKHKIKTEYDDFDNFIKSL